jgi:uncharacterized phiE125 gp8 family phage protein
MNLKLVTAPTAEPVTLTEIKAYLRLDADTTFDSGLTALIKAARTEAENFQNRAYMARTYDLALDSFPDMPLRVPMPSLVSVESIKYTDEDGVITTIPSSDYIIDQISEPGRIAFAKGKSWPSVSLQSVNGVVIRFVAGSGSAPENAKLAIKFFVGFRFENPEEKEMPSTFYDLLWGDRMVPV